MALLDVKTLSLVALITSLLLPLVLTTSAAFTSSHTPATRTLIHGAMAYAVGFLLLALRGSVPDWLSFFIGNVLVVGGFAEVAVGLQLYLRGQANRRWMVPITAGNALGMYWCVVINPDPSLRVFTSSVFLLPICILLAFEFLAAARRAGASNERGATAEKRLLLALAVVFLMSALSFALRAHNFWNVHGNIDPATTGGRTWGLSFLVGVLLNIMLATCMPLLISRRNQRELSQSQALLQETERLADVGSFLYAPDTEHIAPNGVMSAWLGITSPGSYPIAVFLNRLDPIHAAELQTQVRAIASGELPQWSGQNQMTDSGDGSPRWLSMHCGSSRDASGRTYVIVSARNITEFQVATVAAIEARNDADRANAAKSAFLANMSHEIRTPMNGVLGLTRLCLDGELPPRERELIEKCHSSAQTLLGVVNDILDFSKIEAGKLTVESVPFRLDQVLDNARNLFEASAGGKGLRFAVDVAEDVPYGLVGDPLRLSQVLNNFLSNAVKFTAQGEIRLAVKALHPTTQTDTVLLQFSVSDTGIGMTAEQRQRLFKPFSQADSSTTRKYGGSGLGLVISGRLITLMGGELDLKSDAGIGSTFITTLSFGLSGETAVRPQTAPAHRQNRLTGVRVLLVEDNPTNVLVATLSLESESAIVQHVGDGLQAVDFLREHSAKVDTVLMDIQMPVMDGFTATRLIRNELQLHQLPIIAMTANVLDSDRQASQDAGMNAHVGKPFDMDQLVRVILHTLGRTETENTASVQRIPILEAPADAADANELVQLKPALARMGNNLALMTQAVRSFKNDFVGMMQTLHGSQGIHPTEQGRVLHTVKGLAATLGMVQLSQLCAALERTTKRGALLLREGELHELQELASRSFAALDDALLHLEPGASTRTQNPQGLAEKPQAAPSDSVPAEPVLATLLEMLEQSDMSALSFFADHREMLQGAELAQFAELECALQALSFDAAALACRQALGIK